MRTVVLVCWVLAGLLAGMNGASAETRIALVIGNSNYQNAGLLPNPVNDATDVANSLRRLGFTVKILLNAKYDDMRLALLDFGRKAKGADLAAMYFAGHGIQMGEDNWLIPTDAQLVTDLDVRNEAIGLQSISAAVSNATRLGLVILDACRNNPFLPRMQATNVRRAVERGFTRVEPTGNVLIAYAARDGTTAQDGSGRNSPFTKALLDNLETPGLEVTFLFRNVRDEVLATTKREQEPFLYGSLSKEPIYLKSPPNAASASGTSEDISLVLPDFEAANKLDTIGAWDTFLKQHPEGSLAAIARERRSKIPGKLAALPGEDPIPKPPPISGPALVVPQQSPPVLGAPGQASSASSRGDTGWILALLSEPPRGEIGKRALATTLTADMTWCCGAVAISNDARWVAGYGGGEMTGGAPTKITIWDLRSNQRSRVMEAHAGSINNLEFSKNGELLLSCSTDGTAKLWNVVSGQRIKTMNNVRPADTCAFSPASDAVAVASRDGDIKTWPVSGAGRPKAYAAPEDGYWTSAIGYSPDAKRIFQVVEKDILIFDLEKEKYVARHRIEAFSDLSNAFIGSIVALGPDTVAVAAGGRVAIIQASTGATLAKSGGDGFKAFVSGSNALLVSQDERAIALGMDGKDFVSVSRLEESPAIEHLPYMGYTSSRKGDVVVGADGKNIRIWKNP